MSNKSIYMIRAMAGIYLIYLGVHLVMEMIAGRCEVNVVFVGGSALFILFGGYLVIECFRKVLLQSKGKEMETGTAVDSEEKEVSEEKALEDFENKEENAAADIESEEKEACAVMDSEKEETEKE